MEAICRNSGQNRPGNQHILPMVLLLITMMIKKTAGGAVGGALAGDKK